MVPEAAKKALEAMLAVSTRGVSFIDAISKAGSGPFRMPPGGEGKPLNPSTPMPEAKMANNRGSNSGTLHGSTHQGTTTPLLGDRLAPTTAAEGPARAQHGPAPPTHHLPEPPARHPIKGQRQQGPQGQDPYPTQPTQQVSVGSRQLMADQQHARSALPARAFGVDDELLGSLSAEELLEVAHCQLLQGFLPEAEAEQVLLPLQPGNDDARICLL
jgi:hypothetical protein